MKVVDGKWRNRYCNLLRRLWWRMDWWDVAVVDDTWFEVAEMREG